MTNATLPKMNICVPPRNVSQREWLDFVISDIERAYKIDRSVTGVLLRRVALAMMAFHGVVVITESGIEDRTTSNYISLETMRDFVLRLTVDKNSSSIPVYSGTTSEALDRFLFLSFLNLLTDVLNSEKGKALGYACDKTDDGEKYKAKVFADKADIF